MTHTVLNEDTVRIGDRSERHMTRGAQPGVGRGAVAAHNLVRIVGEVRRNPPHVLPDHQQALSAVRPTGRRGSRGSAPRRRTAAGVTLDAQVVGRWLRNGRAQLS